MTLTDADKNFLVKRNSDKEDAEFFDVLQKPFSIHGVIYEDNRFVRMPSSVSARVNDGVNFLNANTAGGRVRFITDSPYITIKTKYNTIGRMPHFALTGAAGFDLYGDGIYCGTFVPPYDIKDYFSSTVEPQYKGLHTYTINLPTYSGIDFLYIGVKKGSVLKEAAPYRNDKPVLYYGSSITQGGCCSRPGCTYEQILSERLNLDYVNLGFSGSARGEDVISDYIASLDVCAFVYDYDHNAPDVGHLRMTHERLFLNFREKHPDTPVLFLTRPKKHLDEDEQQRLSVVRATYENALSRGDKNVYFIAGNELLRDELAEFSLVDNCHPADIGFISMADKIETTLKKMTGE